MRKLLAILLCAIIPQAWSAAISAAAEWDIQGGAGSATNGCAFTAGSGGTDYSQIGATPHLAILTGTTSVTTNVITFTDGTTVAATDVGNFVYVVSGTNMTAGWFEIVSVSAGVNGSWTMNANVVSSGTSTDMVANMGGSCDEPNTVLSSTVGPVAGNSIHIKNATYTRTTTISLGASGSASAGSIKVMGYNTAHNDITTWAGMTNAPIITSATNSTALVTTNSRTLLSWRALKFTHTATTRGNCFVGSGTSSNMKWSLVQFSGCLSAINSASADVNGVFSMVDVADSTSFGLFVGSNVTIIDSRVHGNASSGVRMLSLPNLKLIRSIVDHNGTAGIALTSPAYLDIVDSAIVFNTGASVDGIVLNTAGTSIEFTMVNSILYGNGRYNLNGATLGAGVTFLNNAWGGAGTANINGTSFTTGLSPITLTADPFTNSGGNDFSLNTTSGGGALLRGLGYPGAFPGGTTVGHSDTGPIQHQDSASGGSGGGMY